MQGRLLGTEGAKSPRLVPRYSGRVISVAKCLIVREKGIKVNANIACDFEGAFLAFWNPKVTRETQERNRLDTRTSTWPTAIKTVPYSLLQASKFQHITSLGWPIRYFLVTNVFRNM